MLAAIGSALWLRLNSRTKLFFSLPRKRPEVERTGNAMPFCDKGCVGPAHSPPVPFSDAGLIEKLDVLLHRKTFVRDFER